MKLFDKYFQPYAEYCLRTTFSEDELKEALAQGRKLRNYPYPENFLEDMEKELDEILKNTENIRSCIEKNI